MVQTVQMPTYKYVSQRRGICICMASPLGFHLHKHTTHKHSNTCIWIQRDTPMCFWADKPRSELIWLSDRSKQLNIPVSSTGLLPIHLSRWSIAYGRLLMMNGVEWRRQYPGMLWLPWNWYSAQLWRKHWFWLLLFNVFIQQIERELSFQLKGLSVGAW